MQTITKIRTFQFLSIIIIYFVATGELIYSSNYLELHNELASEKAGDFFEVANKYTIALGEQDQVGESAWQHFITEYVPEIFKTCDGKYFALFYYEEEIYTPPKITKLYHVITRQGTYHYIPHYDIVGLTDLKYNYKLNNQSDGYLNIELQIFGRNLATNDINKLMELSIDMDYSYNVINAVRSSVVGRGFAVFGEGKHPSALTCNYLKSNLGKEVE